MLRLYGLCLLLWLASFQCVNAQDEWLQSLMDTTGMFDSRPGLGNRKIQVDEQTALRRLNSGVSRNNQQSVAVNAAVLGHIYLSRSEYNKALQYFDQSLAANKKIPSQKGQSIAIAQTGMVYFRMQNYEKALINFRSALLLMEELRFQRGIAPVASFAARCATKLKLQDAEALYKRSLNAYLSAKEEAAAGTVYNFLGEHYLINDDYENALQSFNKAFAIVSKGKDQQRKAIIQRDIGLVYFKKGMIEKSLDYFSRSLAFDDQLLVSKLKKEALMKLFTIYSFNKDFAKADVFHEHYRSLKDSIDKVKPKFNSEEERQNELAEKENIIAMLERQTQEQQVIANQKELELSEQITATDIERQNKEKALEQLQVTSDEMEKMSKEKALQERDLARKELQLTQSRAFRNMFLFFSVIILVLAYFIYNRYRINKTNNAKLKKANDNLASTLDELRRTQDQLIHSEKLASLGQMTAGIAHEIKNPLNFINNFSEVSIEIMKEFKEATSDEEREQIADDIEHNLQKISEHSKRADDIVKSMLLHSRKESHEKKLTDINKLIESSYQLAWQAVQTRNPDLNITVQYYLDQAIPSIKIQPQEIERVFVNILDNAFYAMIRKAKKYKEYEPVISILSVRENDIVKIRLSDNADGIPPEIIKNIFQPFFTTKPAGEGTGLGLSLCYDIITKTHGGTIGVKSDPGKGTVFTIRLPLT